MEQEQPGRVRHLAWEACHNARDLGGLPTRDGGATRWKAVIRSDHLGRLTPQGRQALLAYGLGTIVDLRGPREVQADPYVLEPPAGASMPAYLHLPFEQHSPQFRALVAQARTRAETYCAVLDHYPASIAQVMRAIAAAPLGGVLVHCHSGKDRTGIVAALLLSIAGVTPAAIADDYAASQARLWPLYKLRVAEASGAHAVDPSLRPTTTAATMFATLDHLEDRYRGVPAYLASAGLTDGELERLAKRLREDTCFARRHSRGARGAAPR